MTTQFDATMFEQLKAGMNKQKTNTNDMYLKLQPTNTFVGRFVPNMLNPKDSIYHFYFHVLESVADGTSHFFMCPSTFGEKCPACTLRFKLYKNGGEVDKMMSRKLARKEKWAANFYVISDPTNPKANGTVKVVRFGKQLNKIVTDAISGERADEFGMAIFDLTEKGCNFKIIAAMTVEDKNKKGDKAYPTFVSSYFMQKSAIEGMTPQKIDEIYKGVYDLTKMNKVISSEEITKIINEHFLCTPKTTEVTKSEEPVASPLTKQEQKDEPKQTDTTDEATRKKMDDLLKGI